MFSKEESKQLREEFWTSFGKSFPRKWILYNTKIKGLSFKFHFDTKKALVAMDLEDDLKNRIEIWEKLISLKSILIKDYIPDLIFEESYFLENGKEISRVYLPLNSKVSIHNKNSWRETMEFFDSNMKRFEEFFSDYKEILKP